MLGHYFQLTLLIAQSVEKHYAPYQLLLKFQ